MEITGISKDGSTRGNRDGMLRKIIKGTWESPLYVLLKRYKVDRKAQRIQRQSDMPIVAKMLEDNKTLTMRRGITLTLPSKEEEIGRLPKRLSTPQEKVQDFQRRLYLKVKPSSEYF